MDDTDDSASNASDAESDVFPDPVEVSVAGLTISVGPPADLNGDGIYEDLNDDGELTILDTVLHVVVVTAVSANSLDLTDEQASAVDVNEDGEVTYEDAADLASQALMTDGGMDMEVEDMPDVSTETDTPTATEAPEETTTAEPTTEEETETLEDDTDTPTETETDTETKTQTETETETETATPTPTATPEATVAASVDDGSGDDLNCEDFDSVEAAQENADNTDDENNLDADNDGDACESGVDG